jgi:hypothetical protein
MAIAGKFLTIAARSRVSQSTREAVRVELTPSW